MSKTKYFITNFFIALFISFASFWLGLGWWIYSWGGAVVFFLCRSLYRDIKQELDEKKYRYRR